VSINFGAAVVGGSGITQAVTLTNSGNASLTISQVNVTGPGFSISGLVLPLSLAPGQSATFNVRFAPTVTGSSSGTVSVVSDAANSLMTITLTGTGVAATFQLTASPTSLGFGNVAVGTSSSQTVTLTNTGNSSVAISQANVSGAGFSASGLTLPLTLAAGQTATLGVVFAPTNAGSVTGSVSVVSNATNSPATVTLSGTGFVPTFLLSTSPTSLSFGNVVVGSSSTQTVTLTNSGNSSVVISQVSVSGAGFSTTGLTPPMTLAAGQTASFSVVFAPTLAGSVTGSVSVVSNATNSPATITLSGSGVQPALTVSPTSLAFGNILVGSSSSQTVTLTNTGNSSLTISQATVTGAGFSLSGLTLPLTLAVAQSSAFTVQFAPTVTGSVIGSASLIGNAPGSPTTIALSGTGVQPQLSVIPTSISFSSVVVGTTNTQTVTLTDSGTASLTISQATVTGAGFTASGLTLPLALAVGQTTNFNVAFAPTATGSVTGSVSLVSNAPGSPTTIALSGTGVAATFQLTASPTSLSFGNVVVGSSGTQTVTLTNMGNSSVTISQVSVSGAGFSTTGLTPPVTLTAGQSTTLNVVFAPAVAGAVTGSVTMVSNATNSPAVISLSGSGQSSTGSLVGCGATTGGAQQYDQSTCGNARASFSPVGTNISACQTLSASTSYTLIADVGSGQDILCFSVSHDTVLNLNGHTVTGYIQASGSQSGVHIYNGAVSCATVSAGCVHLGAGDTINNPVILEYLTATGTSTTGGGFTILIDHGGAASNLGPNPTDILRHLTVQAPPNPSSPRTDNIRLVGSNVISDIHDNLLTCPPNANACQGLETWNGIAHEVYNNKIVLADSTLLPQDGRGWDCDGSTLTTNRSCNGHHNYISVVNNRGFRWRELSGSDALVPGNGFNFHDNLLDNIRNTTEGAIHTCDPDSGMSNASNVSFYSSTFIVGANGTVLFTRNCDSTGGAVLRNNTVKCASGGCSGSQLATVSAPVAGGSASHGTFKNNTLDAGIGGISVSSLVSVASYCNTGTCGGAGICFLIPPPCN
jgi:uncharacterized protein (DUF58 family)